MKKNSKKILSILLCAILCLAMACPLLAASSGKTVTLTYNATGTISSVKVANSGSSKNYLVKNLNAVHQGTVTNQITVTTKSNVKSGDKGNAVYFIQALLYKKGCFANTSINKCIDGSFGNMTYTAVKTFQTKYSLSADGIVGTKTFAKLTGN